MTFPGKDYDADRQCQLTFGPDSRHCPQLPPPCAALWCSGHLNGHAMCQTKHSPWADGTPCGPAQACMGGRCLHVDQLQDFNVRSQARGASRGPGGVGTGPGPGRLYLLARHPFCFCRSHRLAAGVPGDHGAAALGAAGAASSSLPGTARGRSPATAASTVRAAAPASVPATPRTAQRGQVSSGRDRGLQAGTVGLRRSSLECRDCPLLSRGATSPFRAQGPPLAVCGGRAVPRRPGA